MKTMIVNVEGVDYRVSFEHTYMTKAKTTRELGAAVSKLVHLLDASHVVRQDAYVSGATTCIIERAYGVGLVSRGYAFCWAGEEFSEAVGRKLSFERAVDEFAFKYAMGEMSLVESRKETARRVRGMMWAEFWAVLLWPVCED